MTTLSSNREPLLRVLCTFTEECMDMIDILRGDQSRSAWIEESLWQANQKRVARRGIKKPVRHGRGRPAS